jgi:hypothetical protein
MGKTTVQDRSINEPSALGSRKLKRIQTQLVEMTGGSCKSGTRKEESSFFT